MGGGFGLTLCFKIVTVGLAKIVFFWYHFLNFFPQKMPDDKIPFSVDIKDSQKSEDAPPMEMEVSSSPPSKKGTPQWEFFLFVFLLIVIVGALGWYFLRSRSDLEAQLASLQQTQQTAPTVPLEDFTQQQADIAAAQQKLDQILSENQTFQAEKLELQQQVLTLEGKIQGLETSAVSLKTETEISPTAELEKRFLTSDEIAPLEARILAFEKSFADQQKEASAIPTEVSDKLATLRETVSTLQKKLEALQTTAPDLDISLEPKTVYVSAPDPRAFDTCGTVSHYKNRDWFPDFTQKFTALPRYNEFVAGIEHSTLLSLDDIDVMCASQNGQLAIALVAAPYGERDGFQLLKYDILRNQIAPALREDLMGTDTNWYQKNYEQLQPELRDDPENFRWFPTPSRIGPRRGDFIQLYGEYTHPDGIRERSTFWYDFAANEIWIKERCLYSASGKTLGCFSY